MERTLLKITFSVFLLIMSNSAWSQEREYIAGILLDAKTQEPVAFASIRIKDRALGIISNTDGSFKIPLKYKEYGDIIEISSMGYQTKEIPLSQLSLITLNTIRLVPGVLELVEAVVKAKSRKRGKRIKRLKKLSAAQIVNKAIQAIPNNYPTSTFSSIGYYRDYQLKKENYVNLNEAILEVVDAGFDNNDHSTTKVRLYDYSGNDDFNRDLQGRYKYDYKHYKKYIDKAYLSDYGGNEFSILRIHDAIRNHKINAYDFVNVLHTDFVANHFFKKEDEIHRDDEWLYQISFAKILHRYRALGTIYIAKRDFAIHKMEYTLYDRTRTTENKQKDKHGIDEEIIFTVNTEYRRKYAKMYLNYISFFNTFQVSQPPKFMLKETVVDLQCKCFVLTFNNKVDLLYAKEKKYYDFKFKGKKIQIDRIRIEKDNEHLVLVYPDMARSEFLNITNTLNVAERKRLETFDMLTITLTGLRDATGAANLINEMQYITYKQFREFFVQEIKPNGSVLNDTLFMKKDIPIFKDQAVVKPDNFDDYWMNTPLQNMKN
ncbi:MAG: carboxypeptidase-like regulatory domain-containing protein [Maribacter sp.]|uniref:carboxypeptidase-like regulatory domain-containing protein n=1 Tax=Maribacter sp. TaxID=1897614 RepID=UPI003297A089